VRPQDLSALIGEQPKLPQPWWIVGKGPSLSRKSLIGIESETTIAINHSCTLVSSRYALFVDIEAISDCAHHLINHPRRVLIPHVPHLEGAPQGRRFEEYFKLDPRIEDICESCDVFLFDTSNTRRFGNGPVVELRYFSSEPAYQIAAIFGATEVRTIGIDGGSSYSQDLDTSINVNNLRFGQDSYDLQWPQLDRLEARFRVPISKSPQVARVFVGATEKEEVPFRVLKYSIEKHSSIPVDVSRIDTYVHLRTSIQTGTRFSLQRFAIPEIVNYQGRAIYMDSDMLVLGDIAELFELDSAGAAVLVSESSTPSPRGRYPKARTSGLQLSLMVLECNRLDWKMERIVSQLMSGSISYVNLMKNLCITPSGMVSPNLNPRWNSLDDYEGEETRLVHFTNVPTQPWRNPDSELFWLWRSWFIASVKSNYLTEAQVEQAIRAGNIHPVLHSVLIDENLIGGGSARHFVLELIRHETRNKFYAWLSAIRNAIFRQRVGFRKNSN
jgi:hypothetical protein